MSSSVHGSHVCHKCGWTFPNPHPSAKHRRAHKKVCGRIDGFGLQEGNPHLAISDDDEDHDQGEETMEDVKKGSGLIGRQVSDRSEEEFSDAVSDFVDASVVNQIPVVGGVGDDDVNGAEKGSTANIIKPLESHRNNESKSSDAVENEMLSNLAPSSERTAFVSVLTVLSSTLGVNEEGNTFASPVSPIADPLKSAPSENTQISENAITLPQITKKESMNGKSEEDRGFSTIEVSSIPDEFDAVENSVQSSKLESTKVGSTVTYSLSPTVDSLENAPRENILTSENPNFPTQVDKDADMMGKSEAGENFSTSEISFVCHENTGLEDSLTDNIQTNESFDSLSPIVEDTAITGIEEHDEGRILTDASVDKAKSEASEMDLNLGKTEKFGNVTSDVLPLDRIMDVADVSDSRPNEVDRSLSTGEALSDGSEIKAFAMDIDLSKTGDLSKEVAEDDTDSYDVRSLALPIYEILESYQRDSQFEASLGSCSKPVEPEAMQQVSVCVDGAQGEPVGIPIGEHSALDVKDCRDRESEKLAVSRSLESDEATTLEMVDDSPVHNEACYDFITHQSGGAVDISSSAVHIVEETIPHEGPSAESKVGLVYAEGECDISEANGTNKGGLESNGSGPISDSIISDKKTVSDSDKILNDSEIIETVCLVEEQGSYVSLQDLSSKAKPQTIAEFSDASNILCSHDVVSNEVGGTTFDDDICQKEDANENSDSNENCLGKANIADDLSTSRGIVPEVGSSSQIKPNLEEIMSTQLDAFKQSGGRGSNANQEENKLESSCDIQECHGQNETPDDKKSVDSTVYEALVVDTMVPVDVSADEPVPVERKPNEDTEVENSQRGSENPEFEESFASATDSEFNDPSLSVAAGSATGLVEGGTLDVHSPNLVEDVIDPLLKQQPEGSSVAPPEGSIDSISQTDSIEGHWGSISDGAVPSARYASDSAYTIAAEVQAGNNTQFSKNESVIKGAIKDQSAEGTDVAETCSANLEEPGRVDGELSSLSEIQTIENQSASLQAGTSPSLSDVVHESKGKQKSEEEIIAKVVSWSSDKSRTPLRSLLVEANIESKQKTATNQSPRNLPMEKDDAISTTKEGLTNVSNNQAPPTTTELSKDDSAKRNSAREWNSPARLPDNREKRKPRYWVPFVCCSSVN